MELKEIVNLRKVREYYDDTLKDELCNECPFRDICTCIDSKNEFSNCIVEKILGLEDDHQDLYDLEEDHNMNSEI